MPVNPPVRQRWLLRIAAICGCLLFAVPIVLEARKGNEYVRGMSLDDAQAKSGYVHQVYHYLKSYSSGITEVQMENDPYYYFYDERSGYLLEFNHYKRLVSKEKFVWFGIDKRNVIDFVDKLRYSARKK